MATSLARGEISLGLATPTSDSLVDLLEKAGGSLLKRFEVEADGCLVID